MWDLYMVGQVGSGHRYSSAYGQISGGTNLRGDVCRSLVSMIGIIWYSIRMGIALILAVYLKHRVQI